MECSSQPTEFVCVVRLGNHYAAVHSKKTEKEFISNHPEKDISIAQATAKAFAKEQKIPFDGRLKDLDKPIITILKQNEKWFPAELRPDKILLITGLAGINLGDSKKEATNLAQAIALSRGTDCIPSIGISLSELTPEEKKKEKE